MLDCREELGDGRLPATLTAPDVANLLADGRYSAGAYEEGCRSLLTEGLSDHFQTSNAFFRRDCSFNPGRVRRYATPGTVE